MSFTVEVTGYDLSKTIKCGQVFRYQEQTSGDFIVYSKDLCCRVRQHGQTLAVDCKGHEDYWANYFNVDFKSSSLKQLMSSNKVLRAAYEFSAGTQLLRQDPFECMISFIISQQKRIPQIQVSIEPLCDLCGATMPEGYKAFPEPQYITRGIVPSLHLGYRGPYVYNAASQVAEGDLVLEDYCADKVIYATAMQRLQRVPGIGIKVANCIALFSLGFTNAFPVDVHIQNLLDLPEMKDFRPEDCGEYAGLVQQYLYNYALYNGY